MIINEIFKDEEKLLRASIENLPVFNCIERLLEYTGDYTNEETLENEFRKLLDSKMINFIIDMTTMYYETKSKEEIIKALTDNMSNGSTSFDYSLECGEGYYLIADYYTESEAYPHIKKFMLDTLNELINKTNQDMKERKIQIVKENLARAGRNMETYTEEYKKYKEELEQLTSDNK